jgi:hypothetical protein
MKGGKSLLFVRGASCTYEPAHALALLKYLNSTGPSRGLTLGVRLAILSQHAPPTARSLVIAKLNESLNKEDDTTGDEIAGSAETALIGALPSMFATYGEVVVVRMRGHAADCEGGVCQEGRR